MITRLITDRINRYFQDDFRIIILIGQRRVGKTVELKRHLDEPHLYFDFEDTDHRELFRKPTIAQLQNILGTEPKILLLDEIQYVDQIGSTLKLIFDHFPHIRVLCSGSASFLMLQRLGDSALGRKVILEMYPLCIREITGLTDQPFAFGAFDASIHRSEITSTIEPLLTFGALPEVWTQEDQQYKREILDEYVNSLLFKDVFEIEGIKHPQKIRKLTQLLALQVGSLVNPNELAQQLEMSRNTVINYIDLLQKFKLISIVTAFSNNPRKELSKPFKVYFTDLGILNTLARDFRPLSARSSQSLGGLFENLVHNLLQANFDHHGTSQQLYFWRNTNGYEVDFVITSTTSDQIIPVEVKFSHPVLLSKAFQNGYADRIESYHCITRDTVWKYI